MHTCKRLVPSCSISIHETLFDWLHMKILSASIEVPQEEKRDTNNSRQQPSLWHHSCEPSGLVQLITSRTCDGYFLPFDVTRYPSLDYTAAQLRCSATFDRHWNECFKAVGPTALYGIDKVHCWPINRTILRNIKMQRWPVYIMERDCSLQAVFFFLPSADMKIVAAFLNPNMQTTALSPRGSLKGMLPKVF